VRKALIGSFLFHVALAISSFQLVVSKPVKYPPQFVYEVRLVGAAESGSAEASADVEAPQPAPLNQEKVEDKPDQMPAPRDEKQPPKPEERPRDIVPATNARNADAKPDSQLAETRVIRASVVSSGKDGRSAIDSPAGNHPAVEPGSGDIDNIEARGAEGTAPLRLTHPESYSETYVILHGAQPKYPEHERERGIEGRVTVELLIDANGFVARTNVLELVGPMSFQNSALDAVRQYEFQPPIENGVPSSMWIKFVITFQIHG
jgi:protein TonB